MAALYRAKAVGMRRSTKRHIVETYHEPVENHLREVLAGNTTTRAYVIDGMFFMFKVAWAWQKGASILVEELVIKTYPGNAGLADVVSFAEIMAKELGCVGVVFGTAFSTNDESLSAAYQQLGLQEEARLLYKEIT